MPRTLHAQLEAVNNGTYQAIFRWKAYATKAGGAILNHTQIKGFKIANLEIEAELATASGGGSINRYVQLLRGTLINGTEYLVGTSKYKIYETIQDTKTGIHTVKASLIPKIRITIAGDDTYQNVITAFCTACDLTAQFKDPGAAVWGYQFLPAGKQVILNDAKFFLNMLAQKYLISASDQEGDVVQFSAFHADQVNIGTRTADFEDRPFLAHPLTTTTRDNEVQFLWRDEIESIHYSGTATKRLHNLGYLESTDSPPDINSMYILGYKNSQIDLALTNNDVIGRNWNTNNLEYNEKEPVQITEVFDQEHSPSWRMDVEAINPFHNTEGGALPSTIERVSNYTPLNTSAFDGNLDATINNLQAFAERVDDMDLGEPGPEGPQGETGPAGPAGVAAGRLFYFSPGDASDIGGSYKKALPSPSPHAESTDVYTNTGTSDTLRAIFATDSGVPGVLALPEGTAFRHIHCKTDGANNLARIKVELYKRATGGTETLLRSGYSQNFSGTTITELIWNYTDATGYTLDITDRLVFKIYTAQVSGGSGSVQTTLYFQGNDNASFIQTTISTGEQGPAGADGAISQIQDEGSNLTIRPTLNFIGAGVTASDDAGNSRTLIDIPTTDWINAPALTYATATTVTCAGDKTALLPKGTRLRWVQTTTKYAPVLSCSYSSGSGLTTITIFTNNNFSFANAAITSPVYSYLQTPPGWPTFFAYSPTISGYSSNPTSSVYKFKVDGNLCKIIGNEGGFGTINAATLTYTAPCTSAAAGVGVFPFPFTNANYQNAGGCKIEPASNVITFYRAQLANWVNGTGNVNTFSLEFEF